MDRSLFSSLFFLFCQDRRAAFPSTQLLHISKGDSMVVFFSFPPTSRVLETKHHHLLLPNIKDPCLEHATFSFAKKNLFHPRERTCKSLSCLPVPQFVPKKLSSALRAWWTVLTLFLSGRCIAPLAAKGTKCQVPRTQVQVCSPLALIIFYLAPPPSATDEAWKLAEVRDCLAVFPVSEGCEAPWGKS